MVNANFGFYTVGTRFHTVNFPTGDNASPQVDQLLGVNDSDVAVGFYTNGQGSNRGYEYNIHTHTFTRVLVPGAPGGQAGPSLTAAAINNYGDVAGFYAKTSSQTDAFLRLHNGQFITLAVPGAAMTQAFGVNDRDEVVGAYTVGSGNSAQMHGFTWRPGHGFSTVDDPHGVGTTTINGVNNAGELVGFYVDGAGNTDGMIATSPRADTQPQPDRGPRGGAPGFACPRCPGCHRGPFGLMICTYNSAVTDEEGGAFELGTDGPKVILVGIDDSVTSLRAGAYAAGLARRQGARLVCVYVEQLSGLLRRLGRPGRA